jgi:CheY-like chemotaxis protein
VVEDDDAIRTLICEVLERLGYAVRKARSGAEALQMCESYPGRIDLIVSDVIMPSMGGREMAARLASSRPEIKILFMSGYTDNAISHHGVLSPRTAFLEKPFMTQTLARKVREVLG